MLVFYTNWFIFPRFDGQTWGPLIFIRPSKREDAALLAHEKVHAKQFLRNPLFGLWYWLSKDARLQYEAEAYGAQATLRPDRLDAFATSLSTKYDLGISFEQARAAIALHMA